MKKSIKNVMFGILMVPALALGLSVFVPATPTSAICSQTDIANGVDGCGISGGALDSSENVGGPTELFGPTGVLTTIINVALYLIGAISVLMLIIGGIRYTMSGGNKDSVSSAKNTILYAVIGVVIALLAYAIVNFILVNLKATA